MNELIGVIQQIIRAEMRGLHVAELGVVERDGLHPHTSNSDKDNYSCDVCLKNSGLVLKQVPVATGHIGTAAIPNEGDLVLLIFDHGDVNQPIIIGRLYNNEDRPPLNKADEVIFRLPLAEADDKTVRAQIRNISSESLPREVLVEMVPKIEVHLQDNSLVARAGKSKMTLNQPGERDGKVVIEAGRSKITMNQDGDITIEAGGNITFTTRTGDIKIEGMNVTVKGQQKVSIEALTEATVKGQVAATVESGLAATLKGTTTSIKGMTSFSPG